MNTSPNQNSEWSRISKLVTQEPEKLSRYEELVDAAERNDRNGISKTSSEEDLMLLRSSYESILMKFPLLTNYWIRYARWELKLGDPLKARRVYKRGLQYLKYSIDLWCNYLDLLVNTTSSDIGDVLAEFEAARVKVGQHFYAYDFYKMYLEFLKSHTDGKDSFKLKYHTLLRVVIEIPLYHHEYFFKEFFDQLSDVTQGTLPYFVNHKELPNFANISDKMMSSKLKKIYTDLYITTQFKAYQLYYFERKLCVHFFSDKFIAAEEQKNWNNYLNFIELHYPVSYTILVYERAIITNCNYSRFWIRYSNFFITLGQIPAAVEVVERGIRLCMSNHHELVLKLVDLELCSKNFLKSRDILLSYIKANISIPLPIYEKLANVERLLHPDDDDYIISLFTELINETNNEWFFKVACLYSISSDKLLQLFDQFKSNFQDNTIYQEALSIIENTKDKESKHNFFNEEMKIYSIDT